MCKGFCKDCDKALGRESEVIACEFCGAPICEHCITSGAAYESPVDGATYCRECLLDIPATLEAYYAKREQNNNLGR